MFKSVILIVMDGWGLSGRRDDNPTATANLPVINKLMETAPLTMLSTSGSDVGLPGGQMGNSEVGHLTMGAGRVVLQELTRINKAIDSGELASNPNLVAMLDDIKGRGSALHLMGLLSDGGVHSHQEHLYALMRIAKDFGIGKVFIHAILDGRDTPPRSGKGYMQALLSKIDEIGIGQVATVSGRFYSMDRDKRYERVELAYRAIAEGKGVEAADPLAAIEASYAGEETDEFMRPVVIVSDGLDLAGPVGAAGAVGAISDGDGFIFFNYRADRAREITESFVLDDFTGFKREKRQALPDFLTMTEYDATLPVKNIFPPQHHANILGEVISKNGISQFRVAETEKYAHVTFFFNGGREEPFAGEERLLLPSQRDVATYDQAPQMRAAEIAEATVARMDEINDGFILVNFANCDMVGHTGDMDAAVIACEAVDAGVGKILEKAREKGVAVIITADHGNVEQMIDYTRNCPYTAHTTNPVPFIYVDKDAVGVRLTEGGLADVAPTILKVMGLVIPVEMTGKPLF